MSRAIDRDFARLNEFIKNYSIASVTADVDQLSTIKSAHKCYLPFLQFWAICLEEANKGTFNHYDQEIEGADLAFSYLREAVSDVGSGFFCCLHGAYKPAHMALRSSIENYLRFSAGAFDESALTTTSVYDLFDLAKSTVPFSADRTLYLGQLRASYVELCKYSHSASLAHMAGIHALQHFPSFDKETFVEWLKHARTCMAAMTCVTVTGQPSLYLTAHFHAREMLEELIPQPVRLMLLKNGPSTY